MNAGLAPRHVPQHAMQVITGSLGGALAVAHHIQGALGAELAALARQAFVSGMDLAMTVGTAVVLLAMAVVALLLPARSQGATPLDPRGPRARADRRPPALSRSAGARRDR